MADKDDSKVAFWVGAVGVPLALIGAAILILWGGWVFHVLWNWFAEPLVHVRLSWAHAIGLMALLPFIRGSRYRKSEGDTGAALVHAILQPAVMLLTGWMAALFMGVA